MKTLFKIQPTNPNLIETTSLLQRSRGNRKFFDQKHKVSYITYANGYIRREINSIYTSPYNNKQYKCQDQFVLNRRKVWNVPFTSFTGKTEYVKSRSVIKEPCPQKRMDIIDRISSNYKGYTGRFINPGHKLIA